MMNESEPLYKETEIKLFHNGFELDVSKYFDHEPNFVVLESGLYEVIGTELKPNGRKMVVEKRLKKLFEGTILYKPVKL